MSDADMARYRAACAQAVDAAKAKLALADVWDMAPFAAQEACPGRGMKVVKSPLRADRSPSFSVFANGQAFDDKAREGVKGGVWEFVEFARPELKPAEVARVLVERAGLEWPNIEHFRPARKIEAAGEAAPAVDEAGRAKFLREQRLARQQAEREQRDRDERARREERGGPRGAGSVLPWPECVAQRWAEGARYRDENPGLVEKLCEKRGWPVAWVDALGAIDALAFPVEARYAVGTAEARRMVAFRVEAPVRGKAGAVELVNCGMHQKFFNVHEGTGGWRFFPAVPKERGEVKALGRCSPFEADLLEVARVRRVSAEESMVAPLPFVVGDLAAPGLVIILEGQWDALTMLGALGGLNVDDAGLRGVAIFGVRGAKGTGTLLAHWGAWLRVVKPVVWLLPDNDGAKTGAHWYPPGRACDRVAGKGYFSEQLAWAGAKRVVVTPLRAEGGMGKDFNDYFKAAKPSLAAMREWMGKLKILS